MLGNPDVGREDLNGQRIVGRLLGEGVEFCGCGVPGRMHGNHQAHLQQKGAEEVRVETTDTVVTQ